MGGAHSPGGKQGAVDPVLAGLYTEPAEPHDDDAPCSAAKPKPALDAASLEKVSSYVAKRSKVRTGSQGCDRVWQGLCAAWWPGSKPLCPLY